MIAMGAGTNHWFHSDEIYRTFFTLLMLCGCEGVNGGGWAHYVGQEKVRPLTGFHHLAFALDWQRPTRHMAGTSFCYLPPTSGGTSASAPTSCPARSAAGRFAGRASPTATRRPCGSAGRRRIPAFDRNPLDLADDAQRGRPSRSPTTSSTS